MFGWPSHEADTLEVDFGYIALQMMIQTAALQCKVVVVVVVEKKQLSKPLPHIVYS